MEAREKRGSENGQVPSVAETASELATITERSHDVWELPGCTSKEKLNLKTNFEDFELPNEGFDSVTPPIATSTPRKVILNPQLHEDFNKKKNEDDSIGGDLGRENMAQKNFGVVDSSPGISDSRIYTHTGGSRLIMSKITGNMSTNSPIITSGRPTKSKTVSDTAVQDALSLLLGKSLYPNSVIEHKNGDAMSDKQCADRNCLINNEKLSTDDVLYKGEDNMGNCISGCPTKSQEDLIEVNLTDLVRSSGSEHDTSILKQFDNVLQGCSLEEKSNIACSATNDKLNKVPPSNELHCQFSSGDNSKNLPAIEFRNEKGELYSEASSTTTDESSLTSVSDMSTGMRWSAYSNNEDGPGMTLDKGLSVPLSLPGGSDLSDFSSVSEIDIEIKDLKIEKTGERKTNSGELNMTSVAEENITAATELHTEAENSKEIGILYQPQGTDLSDISAISDLDKTCTTPELQVYAETIKEKDQSSEGASWKSHIRCKMEQGENSREQEIAESENKGVKNTSSGELQNKLIEKLPESEAECVVRGQDGMDGISQQSQGSCPEEETNYAPVPEQVNLYTPKDVDMDSSESELETEPSLAGIENTTACEKPLLYMPKFADLSDSETESEDASLCPEPQEVANSNVSNNGKQALLSVNTEVREEAGKSQISSDTVVASGELLEDPVQGTIKLIDENNRTYQIANTLPEQSKEGPPMDDKVLDCRTRAPVNRSKDQMMSGSVKAIASFTFPYEDDSCVKEQEEFNQRKYEHRYHKPQRQTESKSDIVNDTISRTQTEEFVHASVNLCSVKDCEGTVTRPQPWHQGEEKTLGHNQLGSSAPVPVNAKDNNQSSAGIKGENTSKKGTHPSSFQEASKESTKESSVHTANGNAVSQSSPPLLGTTPSTPSTKEVASLKNEVSLLRIELVKCRETISKLQEREKQMRDRLSEQAQKQLEKGSTKFEDLNLGENRPTQLIRRYGNLFSEVRLDAFDALDDLPEIAEFDDLKGKLLFSVVVLGFRSAQKSLSDMRGKLHELLYIPTPDTPDSLIADPIAKEMDDMVAVYLRKTIDKYEVKSNVEEVCSQVYATLYDYPCLKECQGLRNYIEECVKLAWALTVQNPPLVIDFDSKVFKEDMHTRFHSSEPECNQIKSVLWPALLEGENGSCVHKGVVIT